MKPIDSLSRGFMLQNRSIVRTQKDQKAFSDDDDGVYVACNKSKLII